LRLRLSRPPERDYGGWAAFPISAFQPARPTARARTAETLNLERALSDLVNQAYALTPAEIDLM
jgi:hypothetical protein